jgi:hypothetical protein
MGQHLQEAGIVYHAEAARPWPRDLDIDRFKRIDTDILDGLRGSFVAISAFRPHTQST